MRTEEILKKNMLIDVRTWSCLLELSGGCIYFDSGGSSQSPVDWYNSCNGELGKEWRKR